MTPYLVNLSLKILAGTIRSNEARQEELRGFFMGKYLGQRGFSNRRGNADLYYSGFAIRGLFLLGGLKDRHLLQSVSDFLASSREDNLPGADLTSLLFSESMIRPALGKDWSAADRAWYLRQLERFRCGDGCFATSENTVYSSVYQTFLTATALELLGFEEEKQAIPVEPVLKRQQADGGFVELEKLYRSGTNPTAAAIGFLKTRGEKPNDVEAAVDFLRSRQLASGGFQANTRIPVPDLLSSFTAFVALSDLDAQNYCDTEALCRYVETMKSPDGGFSASDWDRQSDVEYTFYGLGLESLLLER